MPDPIGNPDAFDIKAGHEYTGYRQNSTFTYDPGVVVMPLASRTPRTAVVRLHGGFGIRNVTVAASKKGSPPILPAAVDTDRDTLIACSVDIPLPAFSTDSPTFDWTAVGNYSYVTTGTDGPRVPGKDMLPAGQYPFPLPMQDAAVALLSEGGATPETVAADLRALIPYGNYLWPFTTYPPQFFNSIVLRDKDVTVEAELVGGPGLGE
jgi:hypothetical protein